MAMAQRCHGRPRSSHAPCKVWWLGTTASFVVTVLVVTTQVTAWMTTTTTAVVSRPRRSIGSSIRKSAASDPDDNDFRSTSSSDPVNMIGPETSRMPEYVLDFLKKINSEAPAEQKNRPAAEEDDYLIAIPVDTCHELMLELESIQRGILYHCPLLVHSCIPAAATRLPLLYVTVPASATSSTTSVGRPQPLDTLQDVVYAAVKQHILVAPTLQFQGLEIDRGTLSSNQVLLAVAPRGPQSLSGPNAALQSLVQELQQSLDRLGWTTRLPYDDDDNNDDDAMPTAFRPRIPFMRLPDNWNWYLEQQQQQKQQQRQFTNANNTTSTTSDAADATIQKSVEFLTADEGGNGISPIHWGKWADDILGGPQRLSQVALYPRRQPQSSTTTTNLEQVFPWPAASIALPNGTEAQIRSEAAFAAYQERRWADAEAAMQQRGDDNNNDNNIYQSSDDSAGSRPSQDDLLLSMTRQKLERLYETETATPPDLAQPSDVVVDSDENGELVVLDWEDIQSELSTPPQRPSDPGAVEDWTRRRIEQAVMSRARVQSERELARKKNKPPIAENAVFAKYKDGTLVPPEQRQNDTQTLGNPLPLPPFPSAQHCIGFWRMVSSPTGFAVEQDDAGDSSRSDNLILRVDGTIAGGPILDPETRQKASGGTWTLQLLDQPEEDALSLSSTTATLRIHLIIPPKKERVLVMTGRLVLVDVGLL